MERSRDVVYRLALRMVGPDAAEDVAQQACLQAWLALGEFRGGSTFATWLCRIASNLCLDHLRRLGRFRSVPLDAVEPTLPGGDEVSDVVLDAVEQEAMKAALARALDQLPTEERLLLHWRVGEGRSYEAIADLLGISPSTVGTRLYRARLRLHRLVTQRIEEARDELR